MSTMRELSVTDLRCMTCGAAPGAACSWAPDRPIGTCVSRTTEHRELVAAGWEWQEVDLRDVGGLR